MTDTAPLASLIDAAVIAVPGVVQVFAAKPVPHVARKLGEQLLLPPGTVAVAVPLSSVSSSGGQLEVLVSVAVTGVAAEVAGSVAAAVRDVIANHTDADPATSVVQVRVSRVAVAGG